MTASTTELLPRVNDIQLAFGFKLESRAAGCHSGDAVLWVDRVRARR